MYLVYLTYVGLSTYSTSAPYYVFDGTTQVGTPSVNQSILVTQNQGGYSQGGYGGVGWLEVGLFPISSGTLTVELTNLTRGGRYVDANGALIIRKGSIEAVPVTSQPKSADAIGVLDPSATGLDPSDVSRPAIAPSAPTVSLSGVTALGEVHVVYNQGPQVSDSQSLTSLIDEVLGVIDGSILNLISGKRKKS
jgi:hypothetical protein